jgi:hypothetical protein
LWIFGGHTRDENTGKEVVTNDLWVLSMEGHTWSEAINIKPHIAPQPAFGGVTAITPGTQAVNILGGGDSKSMFDSQWYFIVLQ